MNNKMLALATASMMALLSAPAAQAAKPVYGAWGYEPSAMDRSVKPGDDFWAYVNGAWDERTQISADRSSAGFGVKLTDEAEINVRKILDEMASNPAQFGPRGRQIGDLYASWMDEAGIEARG